MDSYLTKFALILLALYSLRISANTQTSVVQLEPVNTEVRSKSSRSNRKNKKVNMNAGFGINYNKSTINFGMGYFIDSNNLLTANYYYGEDEDLPGDLRKEIVNVFSLEYKHFAANSFYIAGNLYHRHFRDLYVGSKPNQTSLLFLENGQSHVQRDLGIGFKIGNQWQWSNFTLGCDWIGLNRAGLILKREGERRIFSDPERLSVTFLNFYLGASF